VIPTDPAVADLAVVGLGGIGSAAAYWAAARGASVTGFEQFSLGHDRGASHDHSRIIRYSYHAEEYVRLAGLAYAAWNEVEEQSGETLVVRCGGLDLFPPGCAIDAADYRRSLEACGVPYEWLASGEIRARWPQFQVGGGVAGLYQQSGGIVAAAAGVSAHQRLAIARGAALRTRAHVESVREVGGGVEVVCDGQVFQAGAAVIAVDAWTNALLPSPLPLTVLREQVTYFDAPDAGVFAGLPVWIWMDEPSFYGFPTYGEAACKIAQDCGGHETSAEGRSFEPDLAELGRVEEFSRSLFGAAIGAPVVTKTCLYTLTPDRDLVLDRVPGCERVWVVVGAAHAYKFASVLGRLLAECALDGECSFPRESFRIDRPALTDAAFVPTWLV
jgi:sarcosine oxidase